MSQEYFSSKGKGKRVVDEADNAEDSQQSQHKYVTVGNGAPSENAARLQAMLEQQERDSGYGGSSYGEGSSNASIWNPSADHDLPTPTRTPRTSDEAENDRRMQNAAIHQLWYNSCRGSLARYINNTIETLKELQEFNAKWPAHYPSVQKAETLDHLNHPRPGLSHTQSNAANSLEFEPPRPGALRRAATSLEGAREAEAESSKVAEQRAATVEPRLITPQIAQDFSILKLDLKLGSLHQTELVHSLEKSSIASLLDGKISSSIKHLLNLRERIEDTSSKVLVTGDLNAGKSTFCNALLRRKVLPEDQQPCTSIFCEVLDARENGGAEEVHAIHKDAEYNRHDESTYDTYKLADLEEIVLEHEKYVQCKVYINDVRTINESLLNNGVVDISLIDAPGLNLDTTKTTAVFARQEEIDVVVFVVNAANHFTLTAREFIWAAAAEKAYIFIVVNGYDNIRDKKRCQKMILEQVAGLSPRTFKESSELVHFVSSNAVPLAPLAPGGGGGGGDGDDDDYPKKDKGKEKEKVQDFEALEQSLRRFVLEKRARSKLAPAKTYLMNVLGDVNTLATVNFDVANVELDRVTRELQDLEPVLEQRQQDNVEVASSVDRTIEEVSSSCYDFTRSTLTDSISKAADSDFGVQYRGIFSAFEYADDLKEAMLSQIQSSVLVCEDHAREETLRGVNAIKKLGVDHVGPEYGDLSFRPDVMFRRKRDALARQVHIETEYADFFDWSTIIQKQEKVAGTGMAMTVVTVVGGRMMGGFGWVDGALGAARLVGNDNLRKLIVPGMLAAAIAGAYYVLSQIPYSLPHRLSTKISAELAAIDYVHANSNRIVHSVRKVLHFPADNLRLGLQHSLENLGSKRDETLKIRGESEVARKYFGNLVNQSAKLKRSVESMDLEHPHGTNM